ncbi:MAG: choice-of-anchor R domain-containing protein [Limisphaerales bacterium]
MKRIFIVIGTILLAEFAAATSARADLVVYDSLGSPPNGAAASTPYGLFDSFTANANETISSLTLALFNPAPGAAGMMTIGLYADSSPLPGALIATLGTIDEATVGTSIGDYNVSLTADPSLTAGTRYWIGVAAFPVEWAQTSYTSGTGVSGEYWGGSIVAYPNSDPAGPFQMELTATGQAPDMSNPASLLGLFVAGLTIARRKFLS